VPGGRGWSCNRQSDLSGVTTSRSIAPKPVRRPSRRSTVRQSTSAASGGKYRRKTRIPDQGEHPSASASRASVQRWHCGRGIERRVRRRWLRLAATAAAVHQRTRKRARAAQHNSPVRMRRLCPAGRRTQPVIGGGFRRRRRLQPRGQSAGALGTTAAALRWKLLRPQAARNVHHAVRRLDSAGQSGLPSLDDQVVPG